MNEGVHVCEVWNRVILFCNFPYFGFSILLVV